LRGRDETGGEGGARKEIVERVRVWGKIGRAANFWQGVKILHTVILASCNYLRRKVIFLIPSFRRKMKKGERRGEVKLEG
jgi:hypothetical protein